MPRLVVVQTDSYRLPRLVRWRRLSLRRSLFCLIFDDLLLRLIIANFSARCNKSLKLHAKANKGQNVIAAHRLFSTDTRMNEQKPRNTHATRTLIAALPELSNASLKRF
jgi:hypothetical protein